MKSKIIHLNCGEAVEFFGSRSQPSYKCPVHGILPDNSLDTIYQCRQCEAYRLDTQGYFDADLLGQFFVCKECETKGL